MSKKVKEPDKEFEFYDGRLWGSILNFNINMDNQLTTKANFLFGASTLILILVINSLMNNVFMLSNGLRKYGLIILLVGGAMGALLSLMIILPKLNISGWRLFKRTQRSKEDIFYYKNISKYYSRDEYINYVKTLPKNEEATGLAYAGEVYNLATNIIPYKFGMLNWAGWVLIGSIIISMVLFVISLVLQGHL